MLTVSEAAALLRSFDRVLILTHIRPDGDTVGCAAGLCAALRAIQRSGGLRAGKSGIYGHRHGGTVPRQCQVLRG